MNRTIAVLISLVFVTAGCFPGQQPLTGNAISPVAAADACAEIGFSPPSTTTYHLLHREQGIDAAIWMKISLPPKDAASLLGAEPFFSASWSTTSNYIQGDQNWPGWCASKSNSFRKSQISLPDAEYLNVVVDEDDSNATVIYLMWHET